METETIGILSYEDETLIIKKKKKKNVRRIQAAEFNVFKYHLYTTIFNIKNKDIKKEVDVYSVNGRCNDPKTCCLQPKAYKDTERQRKDGYEVAAGFTLILGLHT